ncbi:MAG: hypothetical protein LUO98_03115 [Methanoregula sp.]|nr:hypothetical protein [Methanoregula sp.]
MTRRRKKRERERGSEETGSKTPEIEEADCNEHEIEEGDSDEPEIDKITSDQTGIDLTQALMLFTVGCAVLVLAWHVLRNVLHVI